MAVRPISIELRFDDSEIMLVDATIEDDSSQLADLRRSRASHHILRNALQLRISANSATISHKVLRTGDPLKEPSE